jgi:hypothetical protein
MLSLDQVKRLIVERGAGTRILFVEEGLDEARPVKGLKIIYFFANADVPDRNAQFLLNTDNDAALGGAIELREDDAAYVGRFFENARLL